jgi:hypothetical protein
MKPVNITPLENTPAAAFYNFLQSIITAPRTYELMELDGNGANNCRVMK